MIRKQNPVKTQAVCQCPGGHCKNHAKGQPCENDIDPTLPIPAYGGSSPISGRAYGWCRECYEVHLAHSDH